MFVDIYVNGIIYYLFIYRYVYIFTFWLLNLPNVQAFTDVWFAKIIISRCRAVESSVEFCTSRFGLNCGDRLQ